MTTPASGTPDRTTLAAWLGIVVCGGSNAVAIRIGNADLAPFWGATLRFGLAAAILFAVAAVRRPSLPRDASAVSVGLYGLLNFGASYAFGYWGLVHAPAGTAQVLLSTSPLLTLLIAAAVGLERLHWQGLAGAVVAAAGIVVIFADQLTGDVPATSVAALLAAAACMAASNVVVKKTPPGDSLIANALGMLIGATILGGLSIVASEPWTLPDSARTWASVIYLVTVGSVGLFMLFLFVIARWSASATSYTMLLMPVVTVAMGVLLLDEAVRATFAVGAVLVLGGVYLGAFAPTFVRQRTSDNQ